jgi:hypothetical protein
MLSLIMAAAFTVNQPLNLQPLRPPTLAWQYNLPGPRYFGPRFVPVPYYVPYYIPYGRSFAEPQITYSYNLGLMRETSREYKDVLYPNGWRNVPIINGYVPSVSVRTEFNGDRHTVYDYRKRIEYARLPSPNKR